MTITIRGAVFALAVLAGCASSRNYDGPGPRYAGAPEAHPGQAPAGGPLRVVSFNIQFARNVDSAIALLAGEPALAGASVLLLQEMDAPATSRIAAALGMHYVYYPSTIHYKSGRDFGNAVLSRWPIVADAKIELPHRAFLTGVARAATAATLQVGDRLVRVYSVHLSTITEVHAGGRRAQLAAVLADAARYERVIVGGDLNQHSMGQVAARAGFAWPTRHGPRTATLGRIDHILTRGLSLPAQAAAGTVRSNRGASDHLPVWVSASWNGEGRAGARPS